MTLGRISAAFGVANYFRNLPKECRSIHHHAKSTICLSFTTSHEMRISVGLEFQQATTKSLLSFFMCQNVSNRNFNNGSPNTFFSHVLWL